MIAPCKTPQRFVRAARHVVNTAIRIRYCGDSARAKASGEMAFWRGRHAEEGTLSNDHYEHLFTTLHGLSRRDFVNSHVLDVGCGPRGSLEWATGIAASCS